MGRPYVNALDCEFFDCRSVFADKNRAAREAIAILKQMGMRFYYGGYGGRPYDPTRRIDKDGNIIIPVDSTHDLLGPNEFGPNPPVGGVASIGYIHSNRNVSLHQAADFSSKKKVDCLALGELAFARFAYMNLRPQFGLIDEASEKTVSKKTLRAREVEYVFWANIYGPEYTEKYGRKFFLDAPGWLKEELDDGGVLYVACESFVDWIYDRPEGILQYYRQKIPNVRLFKSKGVTF